MTDGTQGATHEPWSLYQRNEVTTEFTLGLRDDNDVLQPVPGWDTSVVEVTITSRLGRLVKSSATGDVELSTGPDPTTATVTLNEAETSTPCLGLYTVDVISGLDERLTYRYGTFRVVRTLPVDEDETGGWVSSSVIDGGEEI